MNSSGSWSALSTPPTDLGGRGGVLVDHGRLYASRQLNGGITGSHEAVPWQDPIPRAFPGAEGRK